MRTHHVREGETLHSIAASYGISLGKLLKFPGNRRFKLAYENGELLDRGEVIEVPDAKKHPLRAGGQHEFRTGPAPAEKPTQVLPEIVVLGPRYTTESSLPTEGLLNWMQTPIHNGELAVALNAAKLNPDELGQFRIKASRSLNSKARLSLSYDTQHLQLYVGVPIHDKMDPNTYQSTFRPIPSPFKIEGHQLAFLVFAIEGIQMGVRVTHSGGAVAKSCARGSASNR